MIALSLEFSSSRRSVALLDLANPAPVQVLGRAREREPRRGRALALVERALLEAKTDRVAVECVMVGLGPGSYTGIRGAIAIAQGWQLARAVKLLGVSTMDALAWQAQESGITGSVHIAVDAQRDEFYLAAYRIGAGVREPIEPLRLATASELRGIAAQGGTLVGPDLARSFSNATNLDPTAEAVGVLAAGRSDFVASERLEPIYLREISFVKTSTPRRH